SAAFQCCSCRERAEALRYEQVLVPQARIPVCATSFGRHVEQVPQGPDHVDVPPVLAVLGWREEQLRLVKVMNPSIALHEDVERGKLISLCILAVVIVIVRIGG